MDWTAEIDGYCERLGPGYWAEPVNALTNLAFVFVALWLWPRSRGLERALCAILLTIGVGSWLFHTHATVWAAMADTAPIGAFILTYVFAAHRRYFGWAVWTNLAATLLFALALVPAAWVFGRLPGFAISAAYWPVPVAIAGYAAMLARSRPAVARGLALGAGILSVSLLARSADGAVCGWMPMGTHFAWHILNAVMLGWMITVLRRDRLDRGRPAAA